MADDTSESEQDCIHDAACISPADGQEDCAQSSTVQDDETSKITDELLRNNATESNKTAAVWKKQKYDESKLISQQRILQGGSIICMAARYVPENQIEQRQSRVRRQGPIKSVTLTLYRSIKSPESQSSYSTAQRITRKYWIPMYTKFRLLSTQLQRTMLRQLGFNATSGRRKKWQCRHCDASVLYEWWPQSLTSLKALSLSYYCLHKPGCSLQGRVLATASNSSSESNPTSSLIRCMEETLAVFTQGLSKDRLFSLLRSLHTLADADTFYELLELFNDPNSAIVATIDEQNDAQEPLEAQQLGSPPHGALEQLGQRNNLSNPQEYNFLQAATQNTRLPHTLFTQQDSSGRVYCFACDRLLGNSDTYNAAGIDLYVLHEHDCTLMLSILGGLYVHIRMSHEADNTNPHLTQLVTDFLAEHPRLQLGHVLGYNGLPIMHLQPHHFSHLFGRHADQRGMPDYSQLMQLMRDLVVQYQPMLVNLQEPLSRFSETVVGYVLLIVTVAGQRVTNSRKILQFAHYLEYRMSQLNRSTLGMDSFVEDLVRDLELSDVHQIVQQNWTRDYQALHQMEAQPFRAGSAHPTNAYELEELEAYDYPPGTRQVDDFFTF